MRSLVLALSLTVLPLSIARADVKEIWTKKCKSCHGEDGAAHTTIGKKQKIQDMTNAEWQSKAKDSKIRESIANGVKDTKMKPFKDKLSAGEIDALVQYIRGFGK